MCVLILKHLNTVYLSWRIYLYTYIDIFWRKTKEKMSRERWWKLNMNVFIHHRKMYHLNFSKRNTTFYQESAACVVRHIVINVLPMRSAGPVPRFSPRMVTLVQAAPSLGEMPVTSGGWRARDMVAWGRPKHWVDQHLERHIQYRRWWVTENKTNKKTQRQFSEHIWASYNEIVNNKMFRV